MAIDLRNRSVSFYNDISAFPTVGSLKTLYVDRTAMLIYIWDGSSYVPAGDGGSSITVVANYSALPDPTTVTGEFFWCSASQGTAWLPGSLGGTYYSNGLYYSNGVSWEFVATPYQATQAEVDTGTNDDKFVTPKTLETKPLAVSRTGTSISFDKIAVYNSSSSPATGNITNDLTGARIGVVQKIYHNNSVAPTFPVGWVKIEGDYVISIENIIFAEWISGTRVEYWVVNDAPSGFVPYTGATANVDLGTFHLDAGKGTFNHNGSTDTLTANHTSGSGIGLLITKGGNNEGLKVNKTSGSGNAATIIGTLEATTLVKTGGTSTQFLMADGTVSTFMNPRVQTVASAATVTPTSTNDLVKITAQAAGLTLANPTGTFAEGQALIIRIKDNGTARAITYGTNFRAIGVTLPTTTVLSKTTYLGIIYNDTDTKWDVVGVTTQA